MTNGTEYAFSVTATNAVGTSPTATSSNAVTPATLPDAPTNVSATAANAQATVTWTASASDGESPIIRSTVTSDPGGFIATTTATSTTVTVTGLTNNTPYTFTVTATNAVGTGPASASSNAVTPTDVPGIPSNVVSARGDAQATVTWTAASDGAADRSRNTR
ncbi:MAG: fibronectin type III domain-containing protein [SAR202 cluster bacterium]|nr:fibronectin type III domain-containing protein [SAR202 cluster bacterium]